MQESFKSHQSMLNIFIPLCLHLPLLSYSHTVWSWHGCCTAQMVTSCAVKIKNLIVRDSLIMEQKS